MVLYLARRVDPPTLIPVKSVHAWLMAVQGVEDSSRRRRMRRSEALAEARVVGMGGRGVRALVRLLLGLVVLVVGEDGVRRFLVLGVGVLGV